MEPIFVVDDERLITQVLEKALTGAGYPVPVFHDAEHALAELDRLSPFLLLLDINLPGISGLEALERVRENNRDIDVLIISGHGTIDMAVEAIKRGATDFLSKPVQLPEVMSRVSRIYETRKLRRQMTDLRKRERERFLATHHQGASPAMAKLYRTIHQVGKYAKIIALLTGASGTGKEMLARYLHYHSQYPEGPFMAINCAAVPMELLESELFGYAPGAFTDARTEGKPGLVEEAADGTLFLDEIGDLSGAMQVKLLRFLQDRSFTRVGETTEQRVECNIIAATNRDLEQMGAFGQFRDDLYYRINVVRLHVPSLAERKEDILGFAAAFLWANCRAPGKHIRGLAESATRQAQRYAWPGNLRELRNVIERACLMSDGPLLSAADLLIHGEQRPINLGPELAATAEIMSMERAMAIYAQRVLDQVDGNKSEAARLLGISRNRLKRILISP